MLKHKLTLIVAALAFCTATAAGQTQNYIYTNNDVAGPNTISAFAVAANGAISQIAGSPFATGGTGLAGGNYAQTRIIVNGTHLYASNSGSNNVSAFTIDPASGTLTPVPGSPFATGSTAMDTAGTSLAAATGGKFLFAANGGSNDITVFSIGPDGSLTPVGAPVAAGGSVAAAKASADGKYLAVALIDSGKVAMFKVGLDGTLTAVAGNFFGGGLGKISGIDINCDGTQLFASESTGGSTVVDAFSIGSDGTLTPIAGSPYEPGVGLNSSVDLLSQDDKELFVSNQSTRTITAFSVASDGTLALVPGSPFTVFLSTNPAGMTSTQDGSFLYVANNGSRLGGFTIESNGALQSIPGSPFFVNSSVTHLFSLAAYPGKSCSVPFASFSATVQVPGQSDLLKLDAQFALGSGSSGIDLTTDSVILQIGSYNITIPAGTFTVDTQGHVSGSYSFQQESNGATISGTLSAQSDGSFQIQLMAHDADTSSFANPIPITLTIGENTGTTAVSTKLN